MQQVEASRGILNVVISEPTASLSLPAAASIHLSSTNQLFVKTKIAAVSEVTLHLPPPTLRSTQGAFSSEPSTRCTSR